MKWNILFASLVLGLGLSTQGFGFDLLDRMLGASGCGCEANGCAAKSGCGEKAAPACGCEAKAGCTSNGCRTKAVCAPKGRTPLICRSCGSSAGRCTDGCADKCASCCTKAPRCNRCQAN